MSFPAYNRNTRNRGNNRPNDPPEILPEFRSSTADTLRRTYEARNREQFDRQQRARIAQAIRSQEERSLYGMKQINPDEFDDDDDEHAIAMAPVHSLFNEPQQPSPIIIHYYEKSKKHKKEKKHKKKHRRRSSSASSLESNSNDKKNRKRRQLANDENLEGDGEGTSASTKRSRVQEELSLFDAVKNPYRLLRKGELKYIPSHQIKDRKEDLENRKYEKAYKHDVPNYKKVSESNTNICVISERFPMMLSDPGEFSFSKQERFFFAKNKRSWDVNVERTYRNKEDYFESQDFIQISHQSHDEADGGASVVKVDPDIELCSSMDAEDYAHFVKSQTTSFQEALGVDIDGQYSVLHNNVNMDKTNVQAWLKLIDFQRYFHAKNESGYHEAEIQNKKAYFERVIEITKKAIVANPGNAELRIKKLQLMQDYHGVNSPEVKSEWKRLENQLLNNIQMWEEDLKMQLNDRSTFKVAQALKSIDDCLKKLVQMKFRIIKSHQYLEGTDEFLVKLIVTRCRLLIAAGYLDQAIGMLQALAEFHFFRPTNLDNPKMLKPERWQLAKEEFKNFWESGVFRIGDDAAEGWLKIEDFGDINEWMNSEEDNLGAAINEFNGVEPIEVEKYKRESFSMIEARCQLEQFRTKYYWKPVHFNHDNKDLAMFDSRVIKFKDIEHLLFPLNDDALIQDLIFKLLHVFGIPIPGLNFSLQEDILRAFSPELFPSHRPNSLRLEGFQKFMNNFIQLLAESLHMNSARIYTAMATMISNSSIGKVEKIQQLKNLAKEAGKLKRWYMWDNNVYLQRECQLAILIISLDELAKLQKKAEINAMISVISILHNNLDVKGTSIWEVGNEVIGDPEKQKLKKSEHLFYLRIIVFILRNLPFSDEKGAYEKYKNVGKKNSVQGQSPLKTKKEFLLSLWANGTVTEIDINQEAAAIEKAKKRVIDCLKRGAPKNQEDLEYRWIANEHEIIFELAALFCYEFPFQSTVQRYKFFQEEKPLFTSELAISLYDSSVLQEIRVNVLQHITRVYKGLEFTPGNLSKLIWQQVHRFPHSIVLIKMLIDVSKGFEERKFMTRNHGSDDYTRLIRSCSQVYIQRRRLQNDLDALNKQEKDRIVGQLVQVYRKAAEINSDNLIPDDYIWVLLIQLLMLAQTTMTSSKIEEIFNIGQKVCPWSKQFLFGALHNRPISDSSFLATLNNTINTHEINHYCIDKEIQMLMTHEII